MDAKNGIHPGQNLHPADALHLLQDGFQTLGIVDFNLAQQRGVAVEGEMRQRADEKILAENKIFNRLPVIGGMVHQNIGEDGDARQRVGDALGILRIKIKEFALMANQPQSERSKVGGVIVVTRNEGGIKRFVVRAEMRAPFEPVKNITEMRNFSHVAWSCTGLAESWPVAV